MNNINPFLNKLILQISLILFDKANPNEANNLQIDPNLPATLVIIHFYLSSVTHHWKMFQLHASNELSLLANILFVVNFVNYAC